MASNVYLVRVFADGPGGGNPAPIVVDAAGMSDAEMRGVAATYGHESGFVLPASGGSGCDFAFRFFVPNHEMEMCGHATVAAVWLLDLLGRLPRDRIAISTPSGTVEARVGGDGTVEISQPAGRVQALPPTECHEILSVLGITHADLAPFPIQNAATSRVKTLVPLASTAVLDALRPNFSRVEGLCHRIGSTGLYPYAPSGPRTFDARQFPKASGYTEDAATGIAAAALAFGLLGNNLVAADVRSIRIRQGRAMGRPSLIAVRFRAQGGCWVGGPAVLDEGGVHER